MPSDFHRLMREVVEPAVDDLHGESFLFVPMLRLSQGRPSPDPQREQKEIVGVLEWHAPEGQSAEAGLSNVEAISAPPVLSIALEHFPAPTAWPRQGDRFESIESGEVFEVVQTRPDGMTRIEFDLVSRGRRPISDPGA